MRISIGKIDDAASKIHSSRVPISSVEFQPRIVDENTLNGTALQKLLVAGGSSVALWALEIIPEKSQTADTVDNVHSDEQQSTSKDPTGAKHEDPSSSNISRWLHAQISRPRISSETLFYATDHAPAYILRARWSPDGKNFASADGSQIFLWGTKKNQCDTWTRFTTILEPLVGEIFDFDWVTPSMLIIGGIGMVTFRSTNGKLAGVNHIRLGEGAICKGLSARSLSETKALIGIATNLQEVFIYEIDLTQEAPVLLFQSSELFQEGPVDVPLLRHCSIDPSGTNVAFAYGERSANSFGTIFDVDDIRQAAILRNSTEKNDQDRAQELIKECQFRLRGHQARVNAIAFGRCRRPVSISPTALLKHTASCDADTRAFVERYEPVIEYSMNSSNLWPQFTRYAQASVDGCLSVWDIYRSGNGNALSGQCIMATPNSIVDQTGLVTDLSWSMSDNILAVASDDGKLTVLLFEDEPRKTPTMFTDMHYLLPGNMKKDNVDESFHTVTVASPLHVEDLPESNNYNSNDNNGNTNRSGKQEENVDQAKQDETSPFILLTPRKMT